MKIIISRKGFDSSYGGVPSPILPDGRVWSLPIPSTAGAPAANYRFDELGLAQVLTDLTGGRLGHATLVHLDPDLAACTMERQPGWRPAFGQVAAAQSHLAGQGVGVGDLFLFFGWFRHVESRGGKWRYVPGAPDVHGLFGWLQVGERFEVEAAGVANAAPWLESHPHIVHAQRFIGQRNTIYVAGDRLRMGQGGGCAGGGVFRRWSPALQLTAGGQRRSLWKVPAWLEPRGARAPMTYHGRAERWRRAGPDLHLQSVAIGQEFVLDAHHYPEAIHWARRLIEEHA